MAVDIYANNAPEALMEALWVMKANGVVEQSRNGKVKTIQEPVHLRILNPRQRVIFDPIRDANPFFHVMEVCWMFAGRNDVQFLGFFNKNMYQYAEADGTLNAAYGFRWRKTFVVNQIREVIKILQDDPNSRQAVINMWSPMFDLGTTKKDKACNTHIYFRNVKGKLNMLVCNRSNDLIWGMLGANVVHMTYLHEYIALKSGIELGEYQVITNNLHIYEQHWDYLRNPTHHLLDEYINLELPDSILEVSDDFLQECESFCNNNGEYFGSPFLTGVAWKIMESYKAHKRGDKDQAVGLAEEITAVDWRRACLDWLARRYSS